MVAKNNGNYSTTEQDTGLKWIDGKKIYQKVFKISYIRIAGEAWTDTGIDGTGIETFISAKAYDENILFEYIGIGFADTISASNIMIYNARKNEVGLDTLVLQYTKTTDTATN